MSQVQYVTSIVSNLTSEQAAVNAFIDILKKEENALIHGEMEDVDFLASDKARIIKVIAGFSEQRCQHLVSQGLSPDSIGMEAWLKTQKSRKEEVEAIWAELLLLARHAQQLNHTNGVMISTRLQHVQRASAALQCAAGNISIYGPKGHAASF